jgi:hypothetical protein
MRIALTFCLLLALTPGFAAAPSPGASPFEGTWRPEPQLPKPNAKPDSIQLSGGIYDCSGCRTPYKIKADGRDQAVPDNPLYDTMAITVVDPHTVKGIAKKRGTPVGEILISVSPDGISKSEKTTLSGVAPKPIEVTSRYRRVAEGVPGSHAVSGLWLLIDTDVTNHAEDTTFRIADGKLFMSDLMGGSYLAKLDGTQAAYNGNPQYDMVSVRQVNPKTLEESDLKDGKVVQKRRWSMGADNNTIHARFDDTQGHIQEQNGHRVQ